MSSEAREEGDQDDAVLLRWRSDKETTTTTTTTADQMNLEKENGGESSSNSVSGGGSINNLIAKLKSPMTMTTTTLDRGRRHSLSRDREGWKQSGDEEDPTVPSSSSPSFASPRRHHRHLHLLDHDSQTGGEALGDPPEWALLLIGCLLGLATGLCVAAFNRGVILFLLNMFYYFHGNQL